MVAVRPEQAVGMRPCAACGRKALNADSVKATAGRPICTARRHIDFIRPTAFEYGPPVSQDHSLCTCPSPVSLMLDSGRAQ